MDGSRNIAATLRIRLSHYAVAHPRVASQWDLPPTLAGHRSIACSLRGADRTETLEALAARLAYITPLTYSVAKQNRIDLRTGRRCSGTRP
jgi:hypothetical protein